MSNGKQKMFWSKQYITHDSLIDFAFKGLTFTYCDENELGNCTELQSAPSKPFYTVKCVLKN